MQRTRSDARGFQLRPTSLLPVKDAYVFCAKPPTALAAVEPVTIVKSTNSEKDVGNFHSGSVIFSCSSPGLTEIIHDKELRVHVSTDQLRIIDNYNIMFYLIFSTQMFHI